MGNIGENGAILELPSHGLSPLDVGALSAASTKVSMVYVATFSGVKLRILRRFRTISIMGSP